MGMLTRSAVLLDWADEIERFRMAYFREAIVGLPDADVLVLIVNGIRNLAADMQGTSCDSPLERRGLAPTPPPHRPDRRSAGRG